MPFLGPVVAAVAGALGISTTLAAIGLAVVAVAAVALMASRAKLGSPLNSLEQDSLSNINEGYSSNVNALGPVLPHQIVYGEARVGGAIVYQGLSNGQKRFHRIIVFAAHEIESFEAIYINDEEVTLDGNGYVTNPSRYVDADSDFTGTDPNGIVRITTHLGTDDQAADADAVAEIAEWTDTHKLSGMAYIHVRFDGLENFGSGIPNVSVKIRGRKVYDPRTDTTAWSANPALCVRDYLLADFGLQEDASSINDTLFNNVADFCDEDIGGSPRFQCNGSFALDSTPEEIIRNLISSFGGIFWNYQGQWAIQPADWRESSLSLTEDDLRGSLEVATRHSRQSNFNTVVGQYKGEETDWQLDNFRPIQDELYLEEDNGIVATSELKLSFSTTENQARRIAAIYLRKNRQQITVSGTFGLRALGVKVGDTVDLTIDHLGWTNKTFEVVDWRLSQEDLKLVVGMILRETNEQVYTGVVRAITDESGNALQDESGNELEAIVL